MIRVAIPLAAIALLTACKTTDSSDWTGGATTPFNQAKNSCYDQAENNVEEGHQTEFFIGCMGSLGWTPVREGLTIEGLDD